MMSQRAALLDLERKKLALLRSKVAEQARRVSLLEQMDDDPLDALLERELATQTSAAPVEPATPRTAPIAIDVQTSAPEPAQARALPSPALLPTAAPPDLYVWKRRPRGMTKTWAVLLSFIGEEGKTYEQVKEFIDRTGLKISHGATRTQLMNYRKDFGFVDNPRKGFYVATKAALEFIKAHEAKERPEDPAADGGGVPEAQPLPLTRAAA